MKVTMIPYAVSSDNGWWTGLSFFNSCCENENYVLLNFDNRLNNVFYKIEPKDTLTLNIKDFVGKLPEPRSRHFITVYHSNNIIPISMCGFHSETPMSLSPIIAETISQALFLPTQIDVKSINPFLKYFGLEDCKRINSLIYQTLVLVSFAIFDKFRGKGSRDLILGDASPQTGGCQGHPHGSHDDKMTIDLNFYTNCENNYTHYYPKKSGKMLKESMIEKTQISEHFNQERNFYFFRIISEIFPGSIIMVHKNIENAYSNYIKNFIGYEGPRGRIQGDTTREYNHDKHIHISFSSDEKRIINPNYSLLFLY